MSYQLSTSDLDPILAAIEERLEETRPRPLQVIASKLLLVATFGLVLTYLLYLTGIGTLIWTAWIWVALQILFALLSWRYLPVVKRQRRLYRDLDLVAPDPTPGLVWKQRTPNQQALVRGAVGVFLVGVVGSILLNHENLTAKELAPLVGMLGLIGGTAYFVWSDRKMPLETVEKLLSWLLYGLLVGVAVLITLYLLELPWQDWFGTLLAVFWPSWLLIKSRQVARIQERFAPLSRAGGLRDALTQRRQEASDSGSEVVELDPDDVTELAYAEQEMIRQDRVEAIGQTKSEEEPWAVFVSDVVHQQLAELEPEPRLAVHNAISTLATAGAGDTGTTSDSWSDLEVVGTGHDVRYRVNQQKRRITVVELIRRDASPDG